MKERIMIAAGTVYRQVGPESRDTLLVGEVRLMDTDRVGVVERTIEGSYIVAFADGARILVNREEL